MAKNHVDITIENVTSSTPRRWSWSNDRKTSKCVSFSPTVHKGKSNVSALPDRLTQYPAVSDRGRQSIRKTLDTYIRPVGRKRSTVAFKDVKYAAITLLLDKFPLSIPHCFKTVLKSKELDEFLEVLILYFSCFFKHKALQDKRKNSRREPNFTERQVMSEAIVRVELAQKQLAICYAPLVMRLETIQQHHMSYRKSCVFSNQREYLLHECLYTLCCYVVWVVVGRKDLRAIQVEVGRLLWSSAHNPALHPGALENEERADVTEHRPSAIHHRQRLQRPSLNALLNQRCTLITTLLPLPKEQSPHLFSRSAPRKQSCPGADVCDTNALQEWLHQELAAFRFGILREPLRRFNATTLVPLKAKKGAMAETGDEDEGESYEDEDYNGAEEEEEEEYEEPENGPGSIAEGSQKIHKSATLDRCSSTSRLNTGVSVATTEAVYSDTE